MLNKKCSKCKELKLTTKFSNCKSSKDGLQSNCKDCQKEFNDKYNPKYQSDNKDYFTEYGKANKNGIIYRIVNPLGETYIGCTKKKLSVRFNSHKGNYLYQKGKGYSTFPSLHNSFDIWGVDAHKFEEVMDCGNVTKKELREIESKMITALKKNGKCFKYLTDPVNIPARPFVNG
jgi:hypothetical protein